MPNNFGLEIDNIPDTITIGAPCRQPATSSPGTARVFAQQRSPRRHDPEQLLRHRHHGTLPLPNSLAILGQHTDSDRHRHRRRRTRGRQRHRVQRGGGIRHGILTSASASRSAATRSTTTRRSAFDLEPDRRATRTISTTPTRARTTDRTSRSITSAVSSLAGREHGRASSAPQQRRESRLSRSTSTRNAGLRARPQDFLQGRTYLGSTQVTTDGIRRRDDRRRRSRSLIEPGDSVTATATDPDGQHLRVLAAVHPSRSSPRRGDRRGRHRDHARPASTSRPGATVTVGGLPATNVTSSTRHQITATTPALPPGSLNDITVTNTDASAGHASQRLDRQLPGRPEATSSTRSSPSSSRNGSPSASAAALRRRPEHAAPADGGLPAEGEVRLCYMPPPCTGGLPRRALLLQLRPLDRGARRRRASPAAAAAATTARRTPSRREQMAVFLLKAMHGTGYMPPACTGDFADVPCPARFADWIEQLAAGKSPAAAAAAALLPATNNKRGQMAVFLVKTFSSAIETEVLNALAPLAARRRLARRSRAAAAPPRSR